MMSRPGSDPYAVLGVTPQVSDDELRRAYRTLIKRHHPDHNGGSPASTVRFAQIQDAYARVAQARRRAGASGQALSAADEDPAIEQRIADLERELAAAKAAERKARAANPTREAAASSGPPRRPTPAELGHYETDDSLTRIIDDAAEGLGERLKDARRSKLSRRLTDLFGGSAGDDG
jgi:curved DNA-binding protein CbpA